GDRSLARALSAWSIAHHLLEDAREVEPPANAIAGGLRARHAALVEVRELLGATEHPVDELERLERILEQRAVVEQPLERHAARRVIGHPLERLPQGGEPLGALAELVDLERRQAVPPIGLPAGGRPAPDAP